MPKSRPLPASSEDRGMSIVHFDDEFVENPSPPGMPFKEFTRIHNDLVAEFTKFGRVGGGGVGLVEGGAQFYLIWGDFYGLDHRYVYMEVPDASVFTEEWLRAAAAVLRRHPGWGIGVQNFNEGYVLVFADRVMIKGEPFESCRTLAEIAKVAQQQLYR